MHEMIASRQLIGTEQQVCPGMCFKTEGTKGEETIAQTRKRGFAKYRGDNFVATTLYITV